MIDVIIPCYNAHKSLDYTLQSIAIQSIKDKVNVLLVDDNSIETYDSFVKKYNKYINISILRLDKNMGPGVAREQGIKNTHNEFIVFMDSDDSFFNVDSLSILYSKINEGFDQVNSLEFDQKRDSYLLLNGNVHGKIYRRKYLEENDIHFNETRFHEDNFFNNFVLLSNSRCFDLNECTYFYTFNNKSITNSNSKEFDRLEIYLKNMYDLLNICNERNYDKNRIARFKIEKYRYLRRIYRTFNDFEKEQFVKWLNKYDPDFMEYINLLDDDDLFMNSLATYIINYLG